ncbi:uncharacterized protein KY384_002326 [Bacidia gigantensis]|uniref:uncharacterized protein n=1 Tax=Bacidia gigantensis TaxID=2732470 RepID=UPI001D046C12|nr:uncharacterized protein KY384_002326 [Bacidia gigantensis]KAG8532449.1 hypothetical protein KY384_002326 [Bacidia gigantensis]
MPAPIVALGSLPNSTDPYGNDELRNAVLDRINKALRPNPTRAASTSSSESEAELPPFNMVVEDPVEWEPENAFLREGWAEVLAAGEEARRLASLPKAKPRMPPRSEQDMTLPPHLRSFPKREMEANPPPVKHQSPLVSPPATRPATPPVLSPPPTVVQTPGSNRSALGTRLCISTSELQKRCRRRQ